MPSCFCIKDIFGCQMCCPSCYLLQQRCFDLFVKFKTSFLGCACPKNKRNCSHLAISGQIFSWWEYFWEQRADPPLGKPVCRSSCSWCRESARRCSSSLFFWHFQDTALTFPPRQSGYWHENLLNQAAMLGTNFIWNPFNSVLYMQP